MYISKFDKIFKLIMEEINQFGLNKNNKNNPNISVKDDDLYSPTLPKGEIGRDWIPPFKKMKYYNHYRPSNDIANFNSSSVKFPDNLNNKIYKTNKNISVKNQLKNNPTIKLDVNTPNDGLYIIPNISYDKIKVLAKKYADEIKENVIKSIKSDNKNDTVQNRTQYAKMYLDDILDNIYNILQDYQEKYGYNYSYEEWETAYYEVQNYIYFEDQLLTYFPSLKDNYDNLYADDFIDLTNYDDDERKAWQED